jgi:hypothetical protein
VSLFEKIGRNKKAGAESAAPARKVIISGVEDFDLDHLLSD